MRLFRYLQSFISPIILEKLASDVNGSILVEYSYGDIRFRVNDYIESGVYPQHILQYIFRHISVPAPKQILVLGAGGGSMIKFLIKKYPQSHITGIELDPNMVRMGKKYLHLDNNTAKFIITDAVAYIKKNTRTFDIIIDDLFIGCDRPPQAESKLFYRGIRRSLTPAGTYIVNRSFLPRYREQSQKIAHELSSYFPYTVTLPHAPNLFLIGSNYPVGKR